MPDVLLASGMMVNLESRLPRPLAIAILLLLARALVLRARRTARDDDPALAFPAVLTG